MEEYGNASGDSGIEAYEYGRDWIRIRFTRGGVYEYPLAILGPKHLAVMKQLADSGRGLNAYINTHPEIKEGFLPEV